MLPSFETSRQRAAALRQRLVRHDERKVLIAKISGSKEAEDGYTQVNCGGYGRIRVFSKYGMHLRSSRSSLPMRPMLRGHPEDRPFRTQVFQLAGCSWRCWYCYVDDYLLVAQPDAGTYMDAASLIDLYLNQPDPPLVIDLSGGEPELVPEWCFWVLKEIDSRGLRGKVFVWLDDNLSGGHMWDYLTQDQIEYMASFPQHSRVACFKGFDAKSFAFNTAAPKELFDQQFEVFARLIDAGFDMYAYTTFTSPPNDSIDSAMTIFVDKLQAIHPNIPLRTIPLRIRNFTATFPRMRRSHEQAMEYQFRAIEAWESQLVQRFSVADLEQRMEIVDLCRR